MFIDGVFVQASIMSECWEFFVMIFPNTGHIHSSSMYDGDMQAGRWMDLAIDN